MLDGQKINLMKSWINLEILGLEKWIKDGNWVKKIYGGDETKYGK